MQKRFDALCQRIEAGFAQLPEQEGMAEIDAAIARRRAPGTSSLSVCDGNRRSGRHPVHPGRSRRTTARFGAGTSRRGRSAGADCAVSIRCAPSGDRRQGSARFGRPLSRPHAGRLLGDTRRTVNGAQGAVHSASQRRVPDMPMTRFWKLRDSSARRPPAGLICQVPDAPVGAGASILSATAVDGHDCVPFPE